MSSSDAAADMLSEPDESGSDRARLKNRMFDSAVRMLGGREHSEFELRRKLKNKFGTRNSDLNPADLAEVIDAVIVSLLDYDLLSDARYAEVAARSRMRKGYGPYYILQELSSKGLSDAVIKASAGLDQMDWLAGAQEIVDRRFPECQADEKQWQRANALLRRRGFDHSVVKEVLGSQPRS